MNHGTNFNQTSLDEEDLSFFNLKGQAFFQRVHMMITWTLKTFSSELLGQFNYKYIVLTLLKCIPWFELVSMVRDVTHLCLYYETMDMFT